RPSLYASSSIERSRGCSTEHRPRPGQRVDSPLISPAVTKWSRVQPANWLDRESSNNPRRNRSGGTHWSPKVVPILPVNDTRPRRKCPRAQTAESEPATNPRSFRGDLLILPGKAHCFEPPSRLFPPFFAL